jgi:hypothetical protein
MAWAGRSETGVSPLGFRTQVHPPIGNPEALSAGEFEGAEPPRPGAGEAGAPRLDTKALLRRDAPPRAKLFRPVRSSLGSWKHATADALDGLAQTEIRHGKKRRTWKEKARQLRCCGRLTALSCDNCGALNQRSFTVIASCGLRVCPVCARRRAQSLRHRLFYSWKTGRRPHGIRPTNRRDLPRLRDSRRRFGSRPGHRRAGGSSGIASGKARDPHLHQAHGQARHRRWPRDARVRRLRAGHGDATANAGQGRDPE